MKKTKGKDAKGRVKSDSSSPSGPCRLAVALGKLPMKPDMLSGQLNANIMPNFTSCRHTCTLQVLCQGYRVDADRGREEVVESKEGWESLWSRFCYGIQLPRNEDEAKT